MTFYKTDNDVKSAVAPVENVLCSKDKIRSVRSVLLSFIVCDIQEKNKVSLL